MLHWRKETITVFHQISCTEDDRSVRSWKRSVFTGCFWGTKAAQTLRDTTLSAADSYVVRIPYAGQALSLSPGDIVIRGRVSDTIADEQGKRETDLLRRYQPDCFTVRTVSDNTKGRPAHYKLEGV